MFNSLTFVVRAGGFAVAAVGLPLVFPELPGAGVTLVVVLFIVLLIFKRRWGNNTLRENMRCS